MFRLFRHGASSLPWDRDVGHGFTHQSLQRGFADLVFSARSISRVALASSSASRGPMTIFIVGRLLSAFLYLASPHGSRARNTGVPDCRTHSVNNERAAGKASLMTLHACPLRFPGTQGSVLRGDWNGFEYSVLFITHALAFETRCPSEPYYFASAFTKRL